MMITYSYFLSTIVLFTTNNIINSILLPITVAIFLNASNLCTTKAINLPANALGGYIAFKNLKS